jgi:hypothetical protein
MKKVLLSLSLFAVLSSTVLAMEKPVEEMTGNGKGVLNGNPSSSVLAEKEPEVNKDFIRQHFPEFKEAYERDEAPYGRYIQSNLFRPVDLKLEGRTWSLVLSRGTIFFQTFEEMLKLLDSGEVCLRSLNQLERTLHIPQIGKK